MSIFGRTILLGDILWPDGAIRPGRLTIIGEKIHSLKRPAAKDREDDGAIIRIPDGGVAAPGFIDLQINGAFGYDFTTHPESIPEVARLLPRHGVTAFLPTIITAPLEARTAAIATVREMTSQPGSARILGLHFEGPYLSPSQKGAHSPQHLRPIQRNDLDLYDPTIVRMITLAPELPDALRFIRALRGRGIPVGLGHSEADYAQTQAAIEAGARWSTHLFNAMRPINHRQPGIVEALLSDARVQVALIPDGIHVHPALLKIVAEVKGAAGVTLISDASAAAGMPDGEYTLGEQRMSVREGAVRLSDGTLAGSAILMDTAIRRMTRLTGLPLEVTLPMTSASPALAIQATSKGRLSPGLDADLVILDANLEVALTMIAGTVV